MLVDVRRRREIGWVAPDVARARGLVHADVIHTHVHREGYVCQVDGPEVVGHAQICDQVLRCMRSAFPQRKNSARGAYHGLLRDRPRRDLRRRVGAQTSDVKRPRELVVREPRYVRVVEPRLVLDTIHGKAARTRRGTARHLRGQLRP